MMLLFMHRLIHLQQLEHTQGGMEQAHRLHERGHTPSKLTYMSKPFEARIDLRPPCSDWLDFDNVLFRENSTDAGTEDDLVGTEVELDAILESPAQVYMN